MKESFEKTRHVKNNDKFQKIHLTWREKCKVS